MMPYGNKIQKVVKTAVWAIVWMKRLRKRVKVKKGSRRKQVNVNDMRVSPYEI